MKQLPAIVLALCLLMGITSVRAGSTPALPALTGPYPVGQTNHFLVDDSREEPFTPDPDDVRELMVTLYYPAVVDADAEPALLFQDATALQAYGQFFESGVIETIIANAYLDAPVRASDAGYPVVIYSPGLGAMPPTSSYFIHNLVSHGYIVIALWHPYSGRVMPRADGSVALGNIVGQNSPANDIISVWTADTRFVLDQLDDLNALVMDQMDVTRIGMFGHSYGGTSTIYTLAEDDRVAAGLAYDHTDLPELIDLSVNQPLMLMGADAPPPPAAYMNRGYRLRLEGSAHLTFTNFVLFESILTVDLDIGTIAPDRAVDAINAYTLAFFDTHLKGGQIPLLDGPSDDYPEMVFEIVGAP